MATNPSLLIQPPQQQDLLGQVGKVMALRTLLQNQAFQQQMQPLQLQAEQQQLETGALALQQARLKAKSQQVMMDAMTTEFAPQQTAGGQAAQTAPAITPGGGTAPVAAPTAPPPTTRPSGEDFLTRYQRGISKALNTGQVLPEDALDLSGKILQQQNTFTTMSKNQQDMVVQQNKTAGDIAARFTAEPDPAKQQAMWGQLQTAIKGTPNAASLYGQDLVNFVSNNPYPGPQVIQQHMGMLQGEEKLLTDQKAALEVKEKAPYDDATRSQYNADINANFMKWTGKPAPPNFLLQPGAGPVELANINKMGDGLFNAIKESPQFRARVSGAEAWAKVGAEVETERRKLLMKESLYPDPLVGVSPQFAAPAAAEAARAGNDYVQAQSAAQQMQSMIDMMRSGNKLAYSFEPATGVLTISQANHVARVNRQEIEAYGGAGNAWDRIMGFVGKEVSGESIPANVVNDIEQVHQQLANNSEDTYKHKLEVANGIYGSHFRPVTLSPNTAATAPNANRPAALPTVARPTNAPPTATHFGTDKKTGKKYYVDPVTNKPLLDGQGNPIPYQP